jgi:hypothetical protein
MPLYFFALTDQNSLSLADDEVGEEVARELSRNRHSWTWARLYISVVDERGVVVFRLPL